MKVTLFPSGDIAGDVSDIKSSFSVNRDGAPVLWFGSESMVTLKMRRRYCLSVWERPDSKASFNPSEDSEGAPSKNCRSLEK